MTIVYGKENLKYNSDVLKNLYLQGISRIKLHRGKWYDVNYSVAQRSYYAQVSRVQRNNV